MSCKHVDLQLEPSQFAKLAGFERPDAQARTAAETESRKPLKDAPKVPSTLFPGPLVLPHDDLNYDPDCPPQNIRHWLSMESRNRMTDKTRDTVYISRVPQISKELDSMHEWTIPRTAKGAKSTISSPDIELFAQYLRAFYHETNVHVMPRRLYWTPWNKSPRPGRRANVPKCVGLAYENQSMTQIRVRRTPDEIFTAQLNLNDLLDTAISILPADAYALLLLVDHDIYENEDDDFCCGRAYGGKRVAVVQTARYNPILDAIEGISRQHMWPMSHCKIFVDGLCELEDVAAKVPTKEQKKRSRGGAMRVAVDAANAYAGSVDEEKESQALWFARLARTVSHELAHCFGIGHCVYYACNMQGSASMREDVRQPPYLCPVCEAKVGHAIANELYGGQKGDVVMWARQRSAALKEFCQMLEADGLTSAMWLGLGAWLTERLE